MSASVAAFWAGGAAGTFATLATYPFDVCRTTFAARGISNPRMVETEIKLSAQAVRLSSNYHSSASRPVPFSSLVEPQYLRTPNNPSLDLPTNQPPRTLTEFAVQLYKQKGIRDFYYGASPAILQIVPYMGLNFMIYDALVAGDKRVQNSGYAGALSGATSKIIVYPIDTVKRRLQAQAFYSTSTSDWHFQTGQGRPPRKYAGMFDCAIRVARDEGLSSFYRGVVPSVLKTTIASSLSFALL